MLSAFQNVVRIPELRQRLLFTLAIIFVVRLGANIPLPGVSVDAVNNYIDTARKSSGEGMEAITSMLTMFTGGALQQGAIFSLGIMPYISASIIMQMLTVLVPSLSKLSREDGGRQKVNQFTRYLTIILCIGQGLFVVQGLQNPDSNQMLPGYSTELMGDFVVNPGWFEFVIPALVTIVAGTMLLMWLGEMVTEKGVGNGVSLIITVNIVASLPGALVLLWNNLLSDSTRGAILGVVLVVLVVLLLLVIAGVIAVTQAQRRIPVQYPKQAARGRQMIGSSSQTNYLPLKVNYAGVMPIIFANALMILPSTLFAWIFQDHGWVEDLKNALSPNSWIHYAVLAVMIFLFSYFWVSIFFQPQQISDELKRAGGYIPGIRPGGATAGFLDNTMTRLTFAGSFFLTSIAIVPPLIHWGGKQALDLEINMMALQLFGGTSVLIIVGVVLDMMRQLETHMIQRNYEGFLRKGRIKGAKYGRVGNTNQVVRKDKIGALLWLYVAMAVVAIVGSVLMMIRG